MNVNVSSRLKNLTGARTGNVDVIVIMDMRSQCPIVVGLLVEAAACRINSKECQLEDWRSSHLLSFRRVVWTESLRRGLMIVCNVFIAIGVGLNDSFREPIHSLNQAPLNDCNFSISNFEVVKLLVGNLTGGQDQRCLL
jgi:hypothetical protein